MPKKDIEDGHGHSHGLDDHAKPSRLRPVEASYEVNPTLVAEAMLRRIDQLAEQRAEYRRALIHSVEVVESPDADDAPSLF